MSFTIFITGASSGIGRASARLFHQRGWNVIATMRSPEKESELTALPNVSVEHADVTDEGSVQAAIANGVKRFGQIDVLLNNAGYGAYGPIEATSLDNIRKEFDTNVIGMLTTIKAIAPHFRRRGKGTITNISSVGGRIGFPLGSLYHGSKFAVEGLSEALQFEMAAIGVRVKIVEPGFTRTNFAGSSFQFNNDESLTDYADLVGKTNRAFQSVSENAEGPESVAETIYQAATDDTSRLRYPSGRAAEELLLLRKQEDDGKFTDRIRELFGLGNDDESLLARSGHV
jgi:NAD(P)-dependent dehydrogenase (short-subunit alcohol dehydrogenase family)